MHHFILSNTDDEISLQPFARVQKIVKALGRFFSHAPMAIVVVGIVIIMNLAGKRQD